MAKTINFEVFMINPPCYASILRYQRNLRRSIQCIHSDSFFSNNAEISPYLIDNMNSLHVFVHIFDENVLYFPFMSFYFALNNSVCITLEVLYS